MNEPMVVKIRRGMATAILAGGLLTFVPAFSSLFVVSQASSGISVTSHGAPGLTVVPKNGATPAWIAEILDRERNSGLAGIAIDPSEGLLI